jgi:hypothetical protein
MNVLVAIDQAHEYTDPGWTVADAYCQNTRDSCVEDGYTAEDAWAAGNWFLVEYAKASGTPE